MARSKQLDQETQRIIKELTMVLKSVVIKNCNLEIFARDAIEVLDRQEEMGSDIGYEVSSRFTIDGTIKFINR